MTTRRLPKMNALLLFLVCASLLQITAKRIVKVEPEQIVVLEGQGLTAMCRFDESISSCLWKGAKDDKYFAVNPDGNLPEGIEYFGQGFEHGECGIKILHVTEKYDGLLQCKITYNLRMEDYHPAVYGNMTVVLAKAPNPPQITVKRLDPIGHKNFEENKRIQAECRIERGRPAANILWFIGNESIHNDFFNNLSVTATENLKKPYDGEKSVRQSLTRLLKYSDNEKDLRCVADHIASKPGNSQAIYQLHVYFSPKPESRDVTQCANASELDTTVAVTIYANPKPTIKWMVDGHEISQRDENGTRRFNFSLIETRSAVWNATLMILKSEDVEKNYTLRARNIIGEKEYRVYIRDCSAEFADSLSVATFSDVTASLLLLQLLLTILIFLHF